MTDNNQNTPPFLDVQSGEPLRANDGAARQHRPTEDFRTLKATMPGIEFGAVQWAAKRVLRALPNGGMGSVTLAEFMRLALLGKVREVVRGEIARGKAVPADIAAVLDQNRK